MSTHLPDPNTCEQARLSRDARFDGLFYTAVTSTGIYCRPVCPAPPPKPHNVRYFSSAAAAEGAGFRPCMRCRPELAPGDRAWLGGDALLGRALLLIEQGMLSEQPVAALAARIGVGERHLRRLFVDRIGVAPLGIHATRRLLFAKQLLTETAMPVTDIALAAGFGSSRRFNDSFLQAYRLPPSELRKRPRGAAGGPIQLRLGYRPPFDFAATLDFLRLRALPGVERVDPDSYARLLPAGDQPAWLSLRQIAGEHALQLELHGVSPAGMLGLVARVRQMFDLDADPRRIAEALAVDPQLAGLLSQRPGLRLPGAWDGFEAAVRAVLGQQVSVAAARTMAVRMLDRYGAASHVRDAGLPEGLGRQFPQAAALADADLESIGLTRARAQTIRTLASAVLDGRIDFRAERALEDTVERWTALPGVGPWTAHYVALRAFGHPDAFPAADLVLRRIAGQGELVSAGALARRAEAWRPWRAYAVIHLWRHASDFPTQSGVQT